MLRIAMINAYNDGPLLRRCLASLAGKVDKTVVIDGAYKHFPHARLPAPHNLAWSTDESAAAADSMASVVVRRTTGETWRDEIEKRNHYLRFAAPGDMVLVIDADEQLCGGLPRDLPDDDCEIMLRRTDHITPYPVYRLFKYRQGLRYEGAHNYLVLEPGGRPMNLRQMPVVDGCHLLHDHSLRPRERQIIKGAYYEKLKKEEEEYRNTWHDMLLTTQT